MTEQRYTTEALGWGAGGERPEAPAAEPFKPLTDEEIAELRRYMSAPDVDLDPEGIPMSQETALRLLDFTGRARALLKRIERTKLAHYYCPECGGEDGVDHEPGCELAALIG